MIAVSACGSEGGRPFKLRGNCEGSPRNRGPGMMNSHVALECTASECCFVSISLPPLIARSGHDFKTKNCSGQFKKHSPRHLRAELQSASPDSPPTPHPPTLPSDDPFVLEDEVGRSECQVKHTVRVLLQRRRRPSFCSALANTILG